MRRGMGMGMQNGHVHCCLNGGPQLRFHLSPTSHLGSTTRVC